MSTDDKAIKVWNLFFKSNQPVGSADGTGIALTAGFPAPFATSVWNICV